MAKKRVSSVRPPPRAERPPSQEYMMPKSPRRRTDNVVAMPTVAPPATAPIAPAISENDIARRAYELYCNRGRKDGHDVEDWLTAERELRTAASSSAA